MARITMRKVQEAKLSEVFSLYLASAAAKGVKDKTLKQSLGQRQLVINGAYGDCGDLEYFHIPK